MPNKQKISISVGEEVLDKIDESVKSGVFRNRSHAFEYGLKKVFDDKIEEDGK